MYYYYILLLFEHHNNNNNHHHQKKHISNITSTATHKNVGSDHPFSNIIINCAEPSTIGGTQTLRAWKNVCPSAKPGAYDDAEWNGRSYEPKHDARG